MTALFDPETGEIVTSGESRCGRCDQALNERLQAEADLRAAEQELRKLRREVTRLSNELAAHRRSSPDAKAAEALFRYWVARCGKSSRALFGEKRRKAVLNALKNYEPEYIARAIDWTAEHGATNKQEAERAALVAALREATKRLEPEAAEEVRALYAAARGSIQRYDELELICRDEIQLEGRHEKAERYGVPTLVGPAWKREFGSQVAD